MILVVGATGQIGSAVVKHLAEMGKPVRAFVRAGSAYQHLAGPNVEFAIGDLRDKLSLEKAMEGVEVVIATANTVAPTSKYSFEKIEGRGYTDLVNAAKVQGIKQFIFISVPVSSIDHKILTNRYKRLAEQKIIESGIPYTIFRCAPFMEAWLSLIGSRIPLKGVNNSPVLRSFWFIKMYTKLVGSMIEKRGIALILGNGKTRHAFIAVDDVVRITVNSLEHPAAINKVFDMGGPQVLSWDEVVGIFSRVMGKPIKPIHTPTGIFRAGNFLLKPFSPAATNLLGLNWYCGSTDSSFDPKLLEDFHGGKLTSVEEFLKERVQEPSPKEAVAGLN